MKDLIRQTNARTAPALQTSPAEPALARRAVLLGAGALAAGAVAGPALARQAGNADSGQPTPPPASPANAPEQDGAVRAGAQGAGWYKTNAGKLPVTLLSDGWTSFTDFHPMFAPQATKEELRKVLRDDFQSETALHAEFIAPVITIGNARVLIDTGSGAGAGPTLGTLSRNLLASGMRAEDITHVLITHAHPDHLGGLLTQEGTPAFPNAEVMMSKSEHDFWTLASPDLSKMGLPEDARRGIVAAVQRVLSTLGESVKTLRTGDKPLRELTILETPGHTPGHISVRVDGGDEELLVTGDLAHNHVIMFAKPAWTVAFDADPQQAAATRRRVFEQAFTERTRVLGFHLPWPGLGSIARRDGGGYRWMPESWRWEA